MPEITPELISDIFGIPRNGDNIQDEDDDAVMNEVLGDKRPSFDEKIAEVQKRLADVPDSIVMTELAKETTPIPKNEIFPQTPVKPTQVETIKVINNEPLIKKIVETPSVVHPMIPTPSLIKDGPVKNEVKEAIKELKEVLKPETEVRTVKTSTIQVLRKIEIDEPTVWLLDSQEQRFDDFYVVKKSVLESLLVGEELKFISLNKELSEMHVAFEHSYDMELLSKQLETIQKYRDRILYLTVKINQQYFLWDRTMDLIKGKLKDIEKKRGAQESVEFDHLRDMEFYYCRLKALYENINAASKTLDGAFNYVSRQISIAMPARTINGLEPQPQQFTKNVKNSTISEGISQGNENISAWKI